MNKLFEDTKVTDRKTIFFWVAASSPYNSIQIQIELTAKIISKLFNVETQVLHPKTDQIRRKLKEISKTNQTIFWHYGGFDTYLNIFEKNRNITFIYHNITPSIFFWKTEPLVSIRSIIGKIQLNLINKKHKWITMSDYNVNELNVAGFKNIFLCPNIISKSSIEPTFKSKEISLLFVGRIAPNKNCIALLEQVEKVATQLQIPINLVIVGSAKRGCRFGKKFSEKYLELKKHQYLKTYWEKEINEEKLSALYKKSWLYISMSLHEGFGVPACESIANGTPALYLECGGQESVLEKIGMVQKNEADQFHTKIIEIISNEDMRQQLHEKQIDIVSKFISPEVDNLVFQAYKQIITN